LALCAMSGFFYQVLEVGSSSSEVSSCRFWKYSHYEQAVSRFPVSTISARRRELIYVIF